MSWHAQTAVSLPEWFGGEVRVDSGMVDVLADLWAAGVRTLWSCEGGADSPPEYAYLEGDGFIVAPRAAEMTVRRVLKAHGLSVTKVEFNTSGDAHIQFRDAS